jgi:hypothetical protein
MVVNAVLAIPDAIMRPDIESIINEHLSAGGEVPAMIAGLARGYAGTLHKIDAFGYLLQKQGVDFRAHFESFLLKKIVDTFDIKFLDRHVNLSSPPEWLPDFIRVPFFCNIVIELARKYPTSPFLALCMNQICMHSPENVKYLLPCRTSLRSFDRVVEDRIRAIQHSSLPSRELLEGLLQCFFTDDLTIFRAAMGLNCRTNTPLIFNMIDRLSKTPALARFFNKLLMKIEGCDDHTFQLLNGHGALQQADLQVLSSLSHHSSFLFELVLRRLSREMLENPDPTPIVSLLASLTSTEVNTEVVVQAVTYVRTWHFVLEMDLSFVLHACRARFFAHAVLTKIVHRFGQNLFAPDTAPSPERRILCEIAFQHRDMTLAVFRIAAAEVAKPLAQPSQAVSEAYEICHFTFRIGHSIDFVRLLGREQSGEPALRRKFLVYILRDCRPPFSRTFLTEVLKTLSAPHVRALFFPEPGRIASAMLTPALGVLVQFTERLNREEGTKTRECDAKQFDELRKEARRTLDLARGTGQPTLRGFF